MLLVSRDNEFLQLFLRHGEDGAPDPPFPVEGDRLLPVRLLHLDGDGPVLVRVVLGDTLGLLQLSHKECQISSSRGQVKVCIKIELWIYWFGLDCLAKLRPCRSWTPVPDP